MTTFNLMEMLLAARIARAAHASQEYNGADYFEAHVEKVADRVAKSGHCTSQALAVAYLHDVLEDTPITVFDLREAGMSEEVVVAVEAMTRLPGEIYIEYVQRAAQNPLAAIVKKADLLENLSNSAADSTRAKRYTKALTVFK